MILVIIKSLIGIILLYLFVDSMATSVYFSNTGNRTKDLDDFSSKIKRGERKQRILVFLLFLWFCWILS